MGWELTRNLASSQMYEKNPGSRARRFHPLRCVLMW